MYQQKSDKEVVIKNRFKRFMKFANKWENLKKYKMHKIYKSTEYLQQVKKTANRDMQITALTMKRLLCALRMQQFQSSSVEQHWE